MWDENFDVAWTRKCPEQGSDYEMMWLALHLSFNKRQVDFSAGLLIKDKTYDYDYDLFVGLINTSSNLQLTKGEGDYI